MRYLIIKIYFISLSIVVVCFSNTSFSKDSKIVYSEDNISNYLSGIISSEQGYINNAFKYLNEVKLLKNSHQNFNVRFVRTLILLEKFDEAFNFSKSVWNEDEYFFEADLLLGLDSFINKDYITSEKYFERLNKNYNHDFFLNNFLGNVLIAWSKASEGKKKESFEILKKIPKPYTHLVKTQDIFLQCYFKSNETKTSFEKLIQNSDYNFSRYNFFLANYLLSQKRIVDAKHIINKTRNKNGSNLLIKQTENFLLKNENKKIKKFFSCENPQDSLSEFFYILSNLYSGEKNYQMSNFYLKISLHLNKKFLPNKALLAENYYYQKKNKLSKTIYKSIKSIGSVYSWHASKSIATILIEEKGKKHSVKYLEKEFNSLSNPNFEHYYELANFYKDNKYYKKSIEYYSLALNNIKKDHFLVPKILDRRGTSYERLNDWENAEKDLIESLKIVPEDPHVLNYLAYSWIDRGINLDRGLVMLKKAVKLRENDGYIIDSLGWAYYAIKNYTKAEQFLQRAVELLPLDPIINDHYADSLWMQNKYIQARYIWNHVLSLESTEKKLKDDISKKLLFGIPRKL